MAKIRYSVDGGATWIDADEGIRIDITDVGSEEAELSQSMTLNFTHEGVIADLWADPEHDEACLETAAAEYVDLRFGMFGTTGV